MSYLDADENGLPIDPTPNAIEEIPDAVERQHARELWRAVNRLLAVLHHWERWWLEFYRTDDLDPGLPVHWSLIADKCLKAIFLHGAGGHVAPGVTIDEVKGWLFRVPDGGLEFPIYEWDAGQGDCVIVGRREPWQRRLERWAAENLHKTQEKVNRLIAGLRDLLSMLRDFPAAALKPTPQRESECPTPSQPPTTAAPAVRINVEGGVVTLGQDRFCNLDPDALRILQAIQAEGGDWISSLEIQQIPGLQGARVDRFLRGLPEELRSLYQGKPGAGYRWIGPAPGGHN